MSESKTSTYFVVTATALAGMAFYFMKRRKRHVVETTDEKYIRNRNVSWFSFARPRLNSEDIWDSQHPDNLYNNNGNNNDPNKSWLIKDKNSSTAAKTDLLHTGI